MLVTSSVASGIETYIRDYARAGVVVDVGAYHGDFTKSALATGKFSAAYLFEANPANVVALRNDPVFTALAEVVPKAVGAAPGSASFHIRSNPTTGSLLPFAEDAPETIEVQVDVTTLDQESFDGAVSVIKIDTQGGDLDVLIGAERLIAQHQPIIFVELIFTSLYERQADPFALMQWLAIRGYALVAFYNEHYGNGWLAFADALFIPKAMAPKVPVGFEAVAEQGELMNEIEMLRRVCAERLQLIERLDADLRRLTGMPER